MRGLCWGAISAQLSVTGSQSSGVSTGALGSKTSELSPPPMVRTVPSGSSVRLCSVRGSVIEAVSRQCGAGAVMSSTYVVATDCAMGRSGSHPRPDFMTFPGMYMTELPPFITTGSTVVHVWVAMSSAYVGICRLFDAATSSRPSGRTNEFGYVGMSSDAPVSCVQVPVAGSNTSGTSALQSLQFTSPASVSMRPSDKAVTVGYQRAIDMGAADVLLCVSGLKIVALVMPTWLALCPPATKTRPSGSIARPAQKRLAPVNGTGVTTNVAGSKTPAPVLLVWSSHARTLPLGIRLMWIATSGQSSTGDHCPTTAGSVDVVLATVTATADDTVWLPTPSRARAVRLCDPFAALKVFQGAANGAVVTSVPRGAPSRKNWTPATTPELSDASAVTLTVPVRVAAGAGALIATDGGVTSGVVVVNETDASVPRILELSARAR